PVYNQVTEVRDYYYGGSALLRPTRTLYQNSVNYTNRHIFNLPLTVEVFDPNNSRISRTEYQYDGQALGATPSVVQHDQAFNPHAAEEGYCGLEPDWNDPDCVGLCLPEIVGVADPRCDMICRPVYYCPYDSSTDY